MGSLVTGSNGEQDVLNEVFMSNTGLTGPFTYVALLTQVDPPIECPGTGYARKLLNPPTGSSPKWVVTLLPGIIGVFWAASNDTALTWGGGADWGNIVGVGLANNAGVIFMASGIGQTIVSPAIITINAGGLWAQFD